MLSKSQRIKLEISAERILSYSFCVNATKQFLATHLETLEMFEIVSCSCACGSSLSIVVFGKKSRYISVLLSDIVGWHLIYERIPNFRFQVIGL